MTGSTAAGFLRPAWGWQLLRPIVFGAVGSLALLGLYLGVITLAQGWGHASDQLSTDRWFVAALAFGFGVQVAMFTTLRALHARAHTGGVAASAGTSAAGMLACCAHHLTDLLPILGVSGAAIFLSAYRTPLLWVGIGMNLAGVVYLARQVARQRRLAAAAVDPLWVSVR